MAESSDRDRAKELHEEGVALFDSGDKDEALAKYLQALSLDVIRADTLYNIGLIHKYRGDWPESLRYNKRSVEIRPTDDAANWNLAIAATALGDWRTAREVWHRLGVDVGAGSGPIDSNFGMTPVRIDPEGEAETVWAHRLCPVRARIENIPFPDSGFTYHDIVLNDGAPTGTRIDAQGREKSVFNVLELLERSSYSTYVAVVEVSGPEDVEALGKLLDASGGWLEDWTQQVRVLCRSCSEGRPHEHHDQDGGKSEWRRERRIGLAATFESAVENALDSWLTEGRTLTEWGLALERTSSL